jgi:hypothetical protein
LITCFRYADGRIEELPSLTRDEPLRSGPPRSPGPLFGCRLLARSAGAWLGLEDPSRDEQMPEPSLRQVYFDVLGLMAALSAGLLWLFERRGWI